MVHNHKKDNKNGRFLNIHGLRKHRLYGVWCSMKARCFNQNNGSYERYGARGISVCEEWKHDFRCFYEWAIKNGYKEVVNSRNQNTISIDRINVDGDYCPENCRWVTMKEQCRNYSKNRKLTYNGETMCLSDMANKYGIKLATLQFRLKSGKTLEQSLSRIDGRTTRWKKSF